MGNGSAKSAKTTASARVSYIPRSLDSQDPITKDELAEEFARTYAAIEAYWEEKYELAGKAVPYAPTSKIVSCFIDEWGKIHTSAAVRIDHGGKVPEVLSSNDAVVQEFIKMWKEKHASAAMRPSSESHS